MREEFNFPLVYHPGTISFLAWIRAFAQTNEDRICNQVLSRILIKDKHFSTSRDRTEPPSA
jgi:hypothetical protein